MGDLSRIEAFLKQTAYDYDMDVSQVRYIYERYFEKELFYDKLEEFIKDRRNENNTMESN